MSYLPAHDMGPAANAFRKDVRAWLAKHWTPEKRAEHLRKPFKERGWDVEFSKLMGRDGWIGIGWPKDFGGHVWIVNGQKLWSTGGDKAEYIWLAVRTDPDAQKHAGISVLMVDLRSPGVTIRPSLALYGKTFSAQFYDNVRVPAANMVGGMNNGWKVITDALAAERVMIGGSRMAGIERAFDHLTEYLKTAVVGGKALKNDPVIRD